MEKFCQRDADKVAYDLPGKEVVINNRRAIILKAQGFSRRENGKGIYKPLLQMDLETAFFPWQRAILFLIATQDHGKPGGCVLIREIEAEGTILKGPKRIAEYFKIPEPGLVGTIRWIGRDAFEVQLTGKVVPQRHVKK